MITTRLDPPGGYPGRPRRSPAHRGRRGGAPAGVCAGPEFRSGPGSPAGAIASPFARLRPARRGAHRPLVASPDGLGVAVLVAVPDVRADA